MKKVKNQDFVKDLEIPKKVAWDKIEKIESQDGKLSYGRMVAEPFERGYGITIGNALRRILLSSLPGDAITSVKIETVLHEFSTIPGVLEDVLSIILNMKHLLLKLDNTGGPVKIHIREKGVKEVKAADIITDKKVKILNPDLHIATLTDPNAKLEMEMVVKRGRGYVSSQMNKEENQPIGVIPVDSLFSPVSKVNYIVEETRVGQLTNYDRLVMEIWTDGRITPQEALEASSRIMKNYISCFLSFKDEDDEEDYKKESGESIKDVMALSIEELELSVRAEKCTKLLGIKTIGDIARKSEKELLHVKNFGKKSLTEIKEKLKKYSLSLGE